MTQLTEHIADHLTTEALKVIKPKMIVGHTHEHPIGLQGMNCTGQAHNPSRTRAKTTPQENMRVKIKDPHTDYYSSDNHSSDSGEQSNPLS